MFCKICGRERPIKYFPKRETRESSSSISVNRIPVCVKCRRVIGCSNL